MSNSVRENNPGRNSSNHSSIVNHMPYRVLLCDDEIHILRAAEFKLKQAGFEVSAPATARRRGSKFCSAEAGHFDYRLPDAAARRRGLVQAGASKSRDGRFAHSDADRQRLRAFAPRSVRAVGRAGRFLPSRLVRARCCGKWMKCAGDAHEPRMQTLDTILANLTRQPTRI